MVASAYFEYGGPTISVPGVWGYIALTRITMQKRKGKQGVAVAQEQAEGEGLFSPELCVTS